MGPREGLPELVAAVRARVVPVAVLPGVDARRVEAVPALEEPGVELAQVLEAHAALVVVGLGWLGRGLRSQSLLLLVVGGEGGEGRPLAAAAELPRFRLALGGPGAVDQVVALALCPFPSAGPSSGGAAAWAPRLSPPSLALGGEGGAALAGGPVAGPRF